MMKFMVRQKLDPDGNVTEDHLQPLARLVADSIQDEPTGSVRWLGGCGTIDTKQFYMLFEAPDHEALQQVVSKLPGLQSIERVMLATKDTLARGLLLGLAKEYEERTSG
ncbi:DUF3303 family protein [Saccharomonospora sp. NPDC006951]